MVAILHTFVPLLCVIGGAVWLVLFVIPIWLGSASRRWPVVDGEILISSVVPDDDVSFRPKVQYLYSVGDLEYQSETVTFKGFEASEEIADKIASSYQRGSKVPVYYHPRHPKWAVLEPGVTHPKYLIPMVIPVALITVGILTLFGVLPLE